MYKTKLTQSERYLSLSDEYSKNLRLERQFEKFVRKDPVRYGATSNDFQISKTHYFFTFS